MNKPGNVNGLSEIHDLCHKQQRMFTMKMMRVHNQDLL